MTVLLKDSAYRVEAFSLNLFEKAKCETCTCIFQHVAKQNELKATEILSFCCVRGFVFVRSGVRSHIERILLCESEWVTAMDCFRSQDRAESPSQKFGIKKKKNENAQNILRNANKGLSIKIENRLVQLIFLLLNRTAAIFENK